MNHGRTFTRSTRLLGLAIICLALAGCEDTTRQAEVRLPPNIANQQIYTIELFDENGSSVTGKPALTGWAGIDTDNLDDDQCYNGRLDVTDLAETDLVLSVGPPICFEGDDLNLLHLIDEADFPQN